MTVLELALHMTKGANQRALTMALNKNEVNVGNQGERSEDRVRIIRFLLEKGFLWGSGDLVCKVVHPESGYHTEVREAFARTILHDLVRDLVHMNRTRINYLRHRCGRNGMDGVVWILGSAPGAFTLGALSHNTVLMKAARDDTNHDEAFINFPELIDLHKVLQGVCDDCGSGRLECRDACGAGPKGGTCQVADGNHFGDVATAGQRCFQHLLAWGIYGNLYQTTCQGFASSLLWMSTFWLTLVLASSCAVYSFTEAVPRRSHIWPLWSLALESSIRIAVLSLVLKCFWGCFGCSPWTQHFYCISELPARAHHGRHRPLLIRNPFCQQMESTACHGEVDLLLLHHCGDRWWCLESLTIWIFVTRLATKAGEKKTLHLLHLLRTDTKTQSSTWLVDVGWCWLCVRLWADDTPHVHLRQSTWRSCWSLWQPLEMDPKRIGLWLGSLLVQVKITLEGTDYLLKSSVVSNGFLAVRAIDQYHQSHLKVNHMYQLKVHMSAINLCGM